MSRLPGGHHTEALHTPYDNLPIGPGSLPPQDVQHHWQIHIDEVDQPQRERRLSGSSMELVLAHCGPYPPISHNQSLKLVERARSGDTEAREKLILHFQRFVVYFAKEAYPRAKRLNVPMEDVVQDGMVGLIKATDKTDPEIAKQNQGSMRSYLAWGIRGNIDRELADKSRLVHIPVHLHDQARTLVLVASNLRAELGREPTDYEIAERAGMVPSKPVELIGLDESGEYDEFNGQYPERVVNRARSEFAQTMKKARDSVGPIMQAARPITSLDGYAYDSSGKFRPLHEVYADEDSEYDMLDEVYKSVLRDGLGQAIDNLSKREQRVLELRYGLDGDEPKTLEEAGRILDVTRERVRQLEKSTIKKIKYFSRWRSTRLYPSDKEELEAPAPRSYPKGRSYIDHVSDIVSYRRDHGGNNPFWLEREARSIAQQEHNNLMMAVAKRQSEKALAARQKREKLATDNIAKNMQKLAEGYISRCDPESLYTETYADESKYLANHHRDMNVDSDFHNPSFRLQFKLSARKSVLRKYGGLAAFMALSLKPDAMPPLEAWKIARQTLFRAIAEFKDIGQTGVDFKHEGQRFVDVYCEAAENAFTPSAARVTVDQAA